MFNLADILAQAQGKQGFDALLGQFGWSPDQAQAAMAALLPAFTMGMNRATQSPAGLADLMSLFTVKPSYAEILENPMTAGPAMINAGQEVLGKLFGSQALTQAIAQQAAAASGIGQDMMAKVMPVMATLLMGSLLKGAMDGQNPLGALLSAMLGQGTAGAAKPATDAMTGLVGAFTNAMGGLMGAKPAPGTGAGLPGLDQLVALARQLQAANPLLNGSLAQAATGADAEASGPRTLGQQAADTWTATMGRMFESGREIQDQQLAQLERLFDQFRPKA
ncbi:DUF937 domain-containing protein [Phreatobacter sp. AB_2022a]|uniref:DUF937 domain-containing protein n=1 Tax=Phreatobacter sp. AB_2022a TaxID=3003134 RepID=UPI00228731BD|nr:DUF937 domain-containing protein [Phreatobacter sp. AB_2022a]MCZ0737804.1 DUF937 domain-containing protein [Phreatobacter sp. AB_2022a]